MAGVATPIGDPRDALFYSNEAALNFQRENALANQKVAREGAESNYRYGAGQLRRAQPLRLTASRNQANSQGLAESGILAQRQGQIQTDYASKGSRLGEIRKAAVDRATKGEQEANRGYELGVGKNLEEATERGRARLEANPPTPEPAAGTVAAGGPAGSRVTVGPGSRTKPLQFGFKEVEAKEARERAARRLRR